MASPVTSLSLSPSSTTLALATPERLLLTTPPHVTSPSPIPLPPATSHNIPNISSLALPSSTVLYTATTRGLLTRHNLTPTPVPAFTITAPHATHALTSVATLSPSSVFATAAKDGLIKLWDPSTATSTAILSGHRYEIRSIALASSVDHHDAPLTIIASAGRDKTVRLWDARSDKPMATLKGHSSWVHSVALASSPAPIAVSCGGDKTVRVWDLLKMQQRTVFKGHEYRVWDVALPANASYCLSASTDATVRAWEIDGERRDTFDAHHDSVLCLAAARDGAFFVSGCEDGNVLVWKSEGLFGHQPNEGDLVVELENAVKEDEKEEKRVEEKAVEEVIEHVAELMNGGDQLVDIGGHVGKAFDGVPLQMDTTPLVNVDTVNDQPLLRRDVANIAEQAIAQSPGKAKSPTPVVLPSTPIGTSTRTRSISSPVQIQDTESLKAAIAIQPEQTPSYDKSAAELVQALKRISELEKNLREANDAAAIKDRELSALKTSLVERDATISRLSAEVDTSKALLHEANVRALLDAQPRKADVSLDYDEPVNKIGAVSDQLSRLAARLDAMIATN